MGFYLRNLARALETPILVDNANANVTDLGKKLVSRISGYDPAPI